MIKLLGRIDAALQRVLGIAVTDEQLIASLKVIQQFGQPVRMDCPVSRVIKKHGFPQLIPQVTSRYN